MRWKSSSLKPLSVGIGPASAYSGAGNRGRVAAGPRITPEVRVPIQRLAQDNPDWGPPKIHGELQKLGFVLSERTVARYLQRSQRRGDAGKKWLAFLHNHREAIVAFDFFTVPTAAFRVLYCFFIIEHERRKILHFNVNAASVGRLGCATTP
jgi:hypothetical protein